MEFQRNPHRAERRRRVLMDESLGHADESEDVSEQSDADALAVGPRYASGALHENQPRLSDFLPQRRFSVACLQLLAVMAYAGLFAVFGYLFILHPRADRAGWTAFDLTGSQGLAAWLGSAALLVSGGLCWFIYSIRRHRADDYRGRYRVWASLGAVCLLGSIDVTAGVRHALVAGLQSLEPAVAFQAGAWCWMLLYAALVLVRIDRLIYELRANRFVAGWAAVALVGYATAAAMHLQAWPTQGALQHALLQLGAACGHLSVLFAAQLYARHVFLDAQGVLEQQEEARRQRRQQKLEKQRERLEARAEAAAAAEAKRAERQNSKQARQAAKAESKKVQGRQDAGQNEGGKDETARDAGRSDADGQDADGQDAGGRKRKKKARSAKAADESPAQPKKSPDVKPETPTASESVDERPAKSRADETKATVALEEPSDDDEDSQKLSKAERRRLRKMKRKNRQAA